MKEEWWAGLAISKRGPNYREDQTPGVRTTDLFLLYSSVYSRSWHFPSQVQWTRGECIALLSSTLVYNRIRLRGLDGWGPEMYSKPHNQEATIFPELPYLYPFCPFLFPLLLPLSRGEHVAIPTLHSLPQPLGHLYLTRPGAKWIARWLSSYTLSPRSSPLSQIQQPPRCPYLDGYERQGWDGFLDTGKKEEEKEEEGGGGCTEWPPCCIRAQCTISEAGRTFLLNEWQRVVIKKTKMVTRYQYVNARNKTTRANCFIWQLPDMGTQSSMHSLRLKQPLKWSHNTKMITTTNTMNHLH